MAPFHLPRHFTALRQGSLRVGQRADPHPPGGYRGTDKRDSLHTEATVLIGGAFAIKRMIDPPGA